MQSQLSMYEEQGPCLSCVDYYETCDIFIITLIKLINLNVRLLLNKKHGHCLLVYKRLMSLLSN